VLVKKMTRRLRLQPDGHAAVPRGQASGAGEDEEDAAGGEGAHGGEDRGAGEDGATAAKAAAVVMAVKPSPKRAAKPAAMKAAVVKPCPERAAMLAALKAAAVTMMRKGPVQTNSGRRHCRPHGGRQMSWYRHGICYGVAKESCFLYGRRRYPDAGLVHSTR
jgi:hypothetical protein